MIPLQKMQRDFFLSGFDDLNTKKVTGKNVFGYCCRNPFNLSE
jgi:hypothetical protein